MEQYFAHIENNKVTSIEVVTREFLESNIYRYTGLWIEVGTEKQSYVGIGDIYNEITGIIGPQSIKE